MTSPMEIAVKRINRLDGEGSGRAFCDLVIGESFLVKGFKVVEGKKGLFVSMPRQQLCETVLRAYESEE